MAGPNGIKRHKTSSTKYEITYGDVNDFDWRTKTRHKNVNYTEPDSDEFDSDDGENGSKPDGVSSVGEVQSFPVTLHVRSGRIDSQTYVRDEEEEEYDDDINSQDGKLKEEEEFDDDDDDDNDEIKSRAAKRRSKRQSRQDDDDDVVISSDNEADNTDDNLSDDSDDIVPRRRHRPKKASQPSRSSSARPSKPQNSSDEDYSEGEDEDEMEEEMELREELADLQDNDDFLEDTPIKKHLRARKEIDYRIPLATEVNDSSIMDDIRPNSRRNAGRGDGPLRRLFPVTGPFGGSDSVSIFGGGMGPPPGGQGVLGGQQPVIGDSDSSDDDMAQPIVGGGALSKNTPLGVINNKKKPALADTDPLGVSTNIDFSAIGGLDDYINQLKEMVTLPLRYPEVYQQFGVTPPRGVLFHGPPGTGKTLMARALAASCSTDGKQITFYMRKGADCLSKWVGEAERQLRVLFEEAKNNQPSIIFFDEIDGLAPVRSSKQEQIHASIVSTLLALMDGMDNRGQVIVIGATNRPDSIDPALRRPGRFDREFYFPLPDLDARKQIIGIQTRKWQPQLTDDFKEELAKLTKGYGGADLRALCTESALNAIQRRYPQIYLSNKKLLIDPSSIHVQAVDFMKSLEKIIPSSARSTSSDAIPLPKELEPLLGNVFREISKQVDHIIPQKKKKEPLEDSLYEVPHDTFQKQKAWRSFKKSRVFRPRLLICGSAGMGQGFIGSAILNHLEGYYVQSFDLGTMFGDATRTQEATIVQLMIEAKRHTPSVIYIPDVEHWLLTISEQARSTFFSILHGLNPTDEVLVLGLAETEYSELSKMARTLFGYSTANYQNLTAETCWDKEGLQKWFEPLVEYIKSRPSDYPDDNNRRKRVLEDLPEAPEEVLAPKPDSQLSRQQERADLQVKNLLKFKLSNLMEHFKNRYKRFRKPPIEDHLLVHLFEPVPAADTEQAPRPYVRVEGEDMILEVVTGKKFYNMDLDIIEERLWNGFYCAPQQFLKDIKMIYLDSQTTGDRERIIKASEMLASTQMTVDDIATNDPSFYQKCKDIYTKYKERVKEQKIVNGEKAVVQDTTVTRGDPMVTELSDDEALLTQTNDADAISTPTKIATEMDVGDDKVVDEPKDKEDAMVVENNEATEKVTSIDQPNTSDVDMTGTDSIREEIMDVERNGAESSEAVKSNQAIESTVSVTESNVAEIEKPQSTVAVQPTESFGNTILLEEKDESHPDYIIDESKVNELIEDLVSFSVKEDLVLEELEQLNAALIDVIWRNRSSWDRNSVILAVKNAFNEMKSLFR